MIQLPFWIIGVPLGQNQNPQPLIHWSPYNIIWTIHMKPQRICSGTQELSVAVSLCQGMEGARWYTLVGTQGAMAQQFSLLSQMLQAARCAVWMRTCPMPLGQLPYLTAQGSRTESTAVWWRNKSRGYCGSFFLLQTITQNKNEGCFRNGIA